MPDRIVDESPKAVFNIGYRSAMDDAIRVCFFEKDSRDIARHLQRLRREKSE